MYASDVIIGLPAKRVCAERETTSKQPNCEGCFDHCVYLMRLQRFLLSQLVPASLTAAAPPAVLAALAGDQDPSVRDGRCARNWININIIISTFIYNNSTWI